MKTIGEYKQEIIKIIRQMEEEHGMDVSEINIYVDEAVIDSLGQIIDRQYDVVIKCK